MASAQQPAAGPCELAGWSVHLHEDEQSPPVGPLGVAGQPSTRVWHTLTLCLREDPQVASARAEAPRTLHLILDRAPDQDAGSVLEAAFGDAALAQTLITGSTHAGADVSASWQRRTWQRTVWYRTSWERMVWQAWAMASPAATLADAYRSRVPSAGLAAEHHARLETVQAALHGIDEAVMSSWREQLRQLLPYTAAALHRPSVAGIAYWHHAGFTPALLATWRGPHPGPLVEDPAVDGTALLPFARAGWSAREHRALARALTDAHANAHAAADAVAATHDVGAAVVAAVTAHPAARPMPTPPRAPVVEPGWAEVPKAEALIAAAAGLSAQEVLTAIAAGSWNPAVARALAALRRPPR